MSEILPQARTTPPARAERYNVSVATVRKWKRRETPEDLSHRPRSLKNPIHH